MSSEIERRAKAREQSHMKRTGQTVEGGDAKYTGGAAAVVTEDEVPSDDLPVDQDYETDQETTADSEPDAGETEDRIAQLEHELNSLKGRVAPAQQESARFRSLYEKTQWDAQQKELAYQRELQELRDQLKEATRKEDIRIEDILSEEERQLYNQEDLNLYVKVAKAVAKHSIPDIDVRREASKVIEERETQAVKDYLRKVVLDPNRGLSKVMHYADDPTFLHWSQVENPQVDRKLTELAKAKTRSEIDRLATELAEDLKSFGQKTKPVPKTQPSSETPKSTLTNAARRKPAGAEGQVNEAALKKELAEIRQLSRSKNPKLREEARNRLSKLEGN